MDRFVYTAVTDRQAGAPDGVVPSEYRAAYDSNRASELHFRFFYEVFTALFLIVSTRGEGTLNVRCSMPLYRIRSCRTYHSMIHTMVVPLLACLEMALSTPCPERGSSDPNKLPACFCCCSF